METNPLATEVKNCDVIENTCLLFQTSHTFDNNLGMVVCFFHQIMNTFYPISRLDVM